MSRSVEPHANARRNGEAKHCGGPAQTEAEVVVSAARRTGNAVVQWPFGKEAHLRLTGNGGPAEVVRPCSRRRPGPRRRWRDHYRHFGGGWRYYPGAGATLVVSMARRTGTRRPLLPTGTLHRVRHMDTVHASGRRVLRTGLRSPVPHGPPPVLGRLGPRGGAGTARLRLKQSSAPG